MLEAPHPETRAIAALKRRALRGSLFARLIGEFRAWRAARAARREADLAERTFALVGVVIGETHFVGEKGETLYKKLTHRWDLYETPLGLRHYVFIASAEGARSETHRTGALVEEWCAGLRNLTRSSEDRIWFTILLKEPTK